MSHLFSKLSVFFHSIDWAILFPVRRHKTNLILCQWQLNESLLSLTNELNEVVSVSWGFGSAKQHHNTNKAYVKTSLQIKAMDGNVYVGLQLEHFYTLYHSPVFPLWYRVLHQCQPTHQSVLLFSFKAEQRN